MSAIWSDRGSKSLEPGKSYVHKSPVTKLHVSEGYRVTIYEGPSMGTKQAAAPFLAGTYDHVQLVPHPHARALRDNRPKLVVVEETQVEGRELLELSWLDRGRRVVQKLEPGRMGRPELQGLPQRHRRANQAPVQRNGESVRGQR